jgi:hypothetical protein
MTLDDLQVRIRGTVLMDEKPWMKLTEDIGGLTMIGKFVRTDLLTVVDVIDDEE